jgi:hypothetical protein
MAKHSTFSPRKVRLPPIKYADFDNTTKDGKKSVKNAKKDQKKNADVEFDHYPKSVSPVKTQVKVDVPVKPVVTNSQTQKADNKPTEKPVEKPIEELPTEKPIEELPTEKPVEQPTEKPVEKPIEKPVEKPIEKPAEKPIEKPIEEALNKPAEGQSQPNSAVNVDNKSQVLQDKQVPKSGTNHDQKPENNSANSVVVDKKSDDKPGEEAVPNEEIQDDTKEANA